MPDEEEKVKEQLGGVADAYQKSVRITDAVWQLIGGVAVGTLGGYFLDRHFATTPWLLIVGSVVGMVAGMTGFLRTALKLSKPGNTETKQK